MRALAAKQTGAITTKLNEAVGVITGTIVIFGAIIAYAKSEFASAAEFEAIVQAVQMDRIERTEDRISDKEITIRRIELIPAEQRTDWERTELMSSKDERQKLLRRLERLEGEQ